MFGSAGAERSGRAPHVERQELPDADAVDAVVAAGKDASAINMPSWPTLRGGMNFDPAAFGKIPGFDPAVRQHARFDSLRSATCRV
jgi:hypothetical protein